MLQMLTCDGCTCFDIIMSLLFLNILLITLINLLNLKRGSFFKCTLRYTYPVIFKRDYG